MQGHTAVLSTRNVGHPIPNRSKATSKREKMLLYHAFYISYAFGSNLLVSLTSILVDLLSIGMFKATKITMFLISMDILMIIISTAVLTFQHDSGFFVVFTILLSVYLMVYSIYATIRCYDMFSKRNRALALIGNALTFIGFIFVLLGNIDVVPNYVGTAIFIVVIPFPFMLFTTIAYNTIKVIKSNPRYIVDVKQRRIVKIFEVSMSVAYTIGFPCVSMVIIGGFTQNAIALYLGVLFPPYIKIALSIANFAVLFNKSLENNFMYKPTGTSVFQ